MHLGMPCIVVMPERTPISRRQAIERKGASVIIHGKTMGEAQAEAPAAASEVPITRRL